MRRQASSLASHRETWASAEPVAKYLPGKYIKCYNIP